MQKRGQVTVFIIVGIIVLIALAFILYYKLDKLNTLPKEEVIPAEFEPVRNYIKECISIDAKQAAIISGLQGGYIDLPANIDKNPNSYITNIPEGIIKVPLWYYNGEDRTPSQEQIEDGIAKYIDANIDGCLDGFSAFQGKFEITSSSERIVKTILTDEGIVTAVEQPIEVKLLGTELSTSMSVYKKSLPIKLKRLYELSRDMMQAENNDLFFENLTIDLMALGPEIPFSGMDFDCSPTRWSVSEVKQRIKNLLFYNLPRINIENTDYTPYPENDLYAKHHFVWEPTEDDFKDITAGVVYNPDWSFEMNVRPSQGDLLKPSTGKGPKEFFLNFICLNVYKFTYDVTYPVMIVMKDDEAFDGEGYMFRFGFPVMIRSNRGEREDFGINVYKAPEQFDEACGEREEEPFVVYAKNAIDYSDLKDVNISFVCANTYECNLGKTKPDAGVYRLETNLPLFCKPGALRASHKDFATITKAIPEENVMDINMIPWKRMWIDVRKRRLTTDMLQDPQKLEKGEYVLIFLHSDDIEDYDYFRKYPLDEVSSDELEKIPIAMTEANYSIEAILMSGEDKVIGTYRNTVRIDPDDLEGNSRMVFNVIEKIPHPTTTEQQAAMMMELSDEKLINQTPPVFGK